MSGKSFLGAILSLLIFTSFAGANAHDTKTAKPAATSDWLDLIASPTSNKVAGTCEKLFQSLFKVVVKNPYGFGGLKKPGAERLEPMVGAVQTVIANFNRVFEGMSNQLAINLMAMVLRDNVLHLGEPGGAKTGHVAWLFDYDDDNVKSEKYWHMQMHEMRTEGEVWGLPNEEGVKMGRILRNTEGSIGDYEYALVDELSAATPALLGSFLSFLNPLERWIDSMGKKIKAKTRSVFMTGNATRAQMMHQFWERLIYTGPALLNRSIFKSWVSNWLTKAEQDRAIKAEIYIAHLRSIAEEVGDNEERAEAREELKRHRSVPLKDMSILESFAQHAFVLDEATEVGLLSLANKFREVLAEKVHESHEKFKDGAVATTLFPAAEMTERLRRSFVRTLKVSAMLDYVDLMGWKGIKDLKAPIVLKPMSLWRLSYILTTMGAGINVFNPHPDHVKVAFNLTRNSKDKLIPPDNDKLKNALKDPVARQEFQNMLEEQEWFNQSLKFVWETLKDRAQIVAKELAELDDQDPAEAYLRHMDFEVAVYKRKMQRGF